MERDVNIVRIGRVALIYQTTDRQETRAWDNRARAWVELSPGEYRTAIQDAIRVAAQLDAPRIIELPCYVSGGRTVRNFMKFKTILVTGALLGASAQVAAQRIRKQSFGVT